MKGSERRRKYHSYARRRHVKSRAWERYTLVLNRFDLKEMASRIMRGEAKFVRFTDPCGHCGEWILIHKNEKMRVLFDRKRRELVTLLPIEAIELDVEPENEIELDNRYCLQN